MSSKARQCCNAATRCSIPRGRILQHDNLEIHNSCTTFSTVQRKDSLPDLWISLPLQVDGPSVERLADFSSLHQILMPGVGHIGAHGPTPSAVIPLTPVLYFFLPAAASPSPAVTNRLSLHSHALFKPLIYSPTLYSSAGTTSLLCDWVGWACQSIYLSNGKVQWMDRETDRITKH